MRASIILFLISTSLAAAGCNAGGAAAATNEARPATRRVAVEPAPVAEQPITRFIRATGTLMAEDQADVAAETGGRIVATPTIPVASRRKTTTAGTSAGSAPSSMAFWMSEIRCAFMSRARAKRS